MKLITLENLKNFWKDVKSYVDNGLSKKADSSHGTHVSYGTINGKAPGTPSAGTSSKVAREDHVHPVQTTVSGNAGTATKLATARTINGTNFDGTGNITTANWGTARNIQIGNAVKSVNGSGNVTWNWSEMQVPRAYSSSYSFGGNQNAITTAQFITMLTDLGAFSQPHWVSRGSWSYASNQYINDTGCGNIHLAGCVVEVFGNTNAYTIKVTTPTTSSSGVTNGDFIYVNNGSNYAPGWRRLYSTAYKPTASEIGAAAASHTHNYAGSSSAGGNANAAVKLATARTINGTSFDGSANITTANWGTARNITIGNTAKSVNGSANVSWSLSEIGAAPAGYGLGTTCQDKSNQDCNNILVTGFYMGSNMTNKPSGCTQGWIYLLVMRHNDSWVRQVAYDFGTASQVYTRVKQNGNWTAWVATDTNTWRGVQDNLTSTATDQSLSANQGKVLKGLIDGKAASNHTHSYLPLSGGTITNANFGPLVIERSGSTNASSIYFKNSNGILGAIGMSGGVNSGLQRWSADTKTAYTVLDTGNYKNTVTPSNIGAAPSSHTHNYAGSSSAGGNANAAVKLATARTINGTNFDGSGNITTANWGTARTITVGNTGKSVNGSGNVSWSLAEIGAAPSSSTSLNTTDKTIVGAINEVFQSGNSVKQNLVDTLIAKGAEDISTSNSWDSLIDIIEGSNINFAPISFNVEPIPNAQYGFRLLGSGPYYESQNMNVHNSYAMCKLNIVCNNNYNVYLDCISYGENNYDYGIISAINTPLSLSYQADTTGVLKSFQGQSSPEVQTVQLESKSGFYYIKYVKDSSGSQGNDSLRFKVRFEKKTGGNPGVPGNPGSGETILFSPTIGGDNRGLTGGYTHKRHTSDSYFRYDASCMDFMAFSNSSSDTLETVISENRINLTNYSRLRINGYFTTTSNDSGGAPLVGFDAIGNRDSAFAASIMIVSSAQSYYDLNISDLTGDYHLKFNVATSRGYSSSEPINKHLYITELILYR